MDDLRRHLQERDSEKRELELKVQEVLRESQEAKTSLAESIRDSSRYCRSLELISRYFWFHSEISTVGSRVSVCVLFLNIDL